MYNVGAVLPVITPAPLALMDADASHDAAVRTWHMDVTWRSVT